MDLTLLLGNRNRRELLLQGLSEQPVVKRITFVIPGTPVNSSFGLGTSTVHKASTVSLLVHPVKLLGQDYRITYHPTPSSSC